MDALDFEIIEFDGSEEHVKMLQEVRVAVWSGGKSQEELSMGKNEILALGETYTKQPNFTAVIITRNRKPIAYCLSYICDFWKDSLNLASEVVVSPKHEWDLVMAMCKQLPSMSGLFPGITFYDGWSGGEQGCSNITSCQVWVMNGMGVIESERGNSAIVQIMIRRMMNIIKRKFQSGVCVRFGFFYTWELEEHPSFYEQIGFQRVNFVDPEEIGKVANRKTYWVADWEEMLSKE